MGLPKSPAAAFLLVAIGLSVGVSLPGCKRPRLQPPFLRLPEQVRDLAAIRAGNQIWLSWTMPQGTTGQFAVNGHVTAHICRMEGFTGNCVDVGEPIVLSPDAAGTFSEVLPPAMASGAPRIMNYFVGIMDRNGRLAGRSNSVPTLAGAPPPAVRGLTAERRAGGILLRWTAIPATQDQARTAVRLYRTTRVAAGNPQGSPAPPRGPARKELLVQGGSRSGQTFDKDIADGESYEYRAQRVALLTAGGQTLESGGQLSAPVRVDAGASFN